MTLRLTGRSRLTSCPRCGGRGRIPAPDHYTQGAKGLSSPEVGSPIPCPKCKGTRVVVVADDRRDEEDHAP